MNNSLTAAKLAFEKDELDKCLHIVDSILTNNNSNTEALLLKAKVLYKKQLWGETLNTLNAILAIEPDNTMAINYKNMAINILRFWHKDNFNP